jgi:hypothetical protein
MKFRLAKHFDGMQEFRRAACLNRLKINIKTHLDISLKSFILNY